jgi:NTE family protein
VADKLAELEEFALSLNRRRVFGLLDISWRGSGLISGNRLTDLLNEQIGETRIEDLPKPLICIATELETGHELWLKQGPMVDAMRASYALPGVFQPVYLHHRWLIDGAVVNPIPVSACRAMGARVVIAVNLNTDAFGSGTVIQAPPTGIALGHRKQLAQTLDANGTDKPSITAVLVAAFNISQDRLARSRLAGDPPDIMIAPRAADIGIFDFDRAADSIRLGREAAEGALPHIEALMDAFERTDFGEV